MTVLVTGAAGFIGSYVSRSLLERGDNVVGVDNFHEYYDRQAKEFAQQITVEKAEKSTGTYHFIEADIRDALAVKNLFETHIIDKVIHLAAMAGVPFSVRDPHLYMDVNILGTTVLADLAVEYTIQNFVFASSSSVYGNRTNVPFKETDDVNTPVSPYAASKRMGETLLYTYHHLYNLPVSCLRFFTVYGPLQRPYGMVIQRFMKQIDHGHPVSIYGDGSMARDFTYIDDIVAGIIASLDANSAYEIFNIGNSEPVRVIDIVDILEQVMTVSAQRDFLDRPDTEVSVTYADISKAQTMLGYNPQTRFEEGVRLQWETYKTLPQWYKDLAW